MDHVTYQICCCWLVLQVENEADNMSDSEETMEPLDPEEQVNI